MSTQALQVVARRVGLEDPIVDFSKYARVEKGERVTIGKCTLTRDQKLFESYVTGF